MNKKYNLLILEDNRLDADLIQREIRKNHPGVTCHWVKDKKGYLGQLKQGEIDCVISDYFLPGYDGASALEDLLSLKDGIPFIIVSGTLGDERAVQIVRMGAFDFVLKDNIKRLPISIENALNEAKEKREKIKARRELEMTVKQLAKSNEELAQFAYVASHDMKTPISNLIRLIELLEELEGIKPFCTELFEKTKQSVQRMNKTIRTLNEVIAVKQNHNTITKDNIYFEEIFDEIKTSFDYQIETTGAEIHADFSDSPALIIGKIHLESIFQNLLSNALKYRLPSRPLQIEVKTHRKNDFVCLSFSDNGEGIDLEKYGEKVFGLFQRFNLSEEGMGVGLHMIKSIVENCGGYIDIKSQPLHGTSFHLYFPYTKDKLPEKAGISQTEHI